MNQGWFVRTELKILQITYFYPLTKNIMPLENLYANSTNIVDEANREYLLHAELIDKWPQIVIKAKNINLMDII